MGYNACLWNEYTYDLNSILTIDIFRTIHTIYLSVVDFILWLCVVSLAGKSLVNVVGGIYGAVSDADYESEYSQDERAFENYARTQRAKDRYDSIQLSNNNNDSYKRNKAGF